MSAAIRATSDALLADLLETYTKVEASQATRLAHTRGILMDLQAEHLRRLDNLRFDRMLAVASTDTYDDEVRVTLLLPHHFEVDFDGVVILVRDW